MRGLAGLRVRRSRHLVCYWRSGAFVVHNYATGVTGAVTPLVQHLLDLCSEWRGLRQLRADLHGSLPSDPLPAGAVDALVARLLALTFLERRGSRRDAREDAMAALDRWNPAAGFFHTATKDVRFLPARQADRLLRRQARVWPMPSPIKKYRRTPALKLPLPDSPVAPLGRVLLERRTWRRFSGRKVALGDLATLLGLTAGVQRWVKTGTGDVPFKTSPSGGARHPIECYVAIRNVDGVRAGVYHYAADRHRLEHVCRIDVTTRLRAWMPQSGYFVRAAFLVFFTAVFERQLWRYAYARAYRAALVEAGHVCQTFCLTATALGLAPFCLMGLADREIERDLRIDGIKESVLYAAGAGVRPRGLSWAPLASGSLVTRDNPVFRSR